MIDNQVTSMLCEVEVETWERHVFPKSLFIKEETSTTIKCKCCETGLNKSLI